MNTITRRNAMPGSRAESRVPGTMVAATAPAKATPERIQARAYEIFRSRNGGPGDAVSDWLRAEAELSSPTQGGAAGAQVEVKARARGEALLAGEAE